MKKLVWISILLSACTSKPNGKLASADAPQTHNGITDKMQANGMYHMSNAYPVGDVNGDHKPDTAIVDYDIRMGADSSPDYYDCHFRHCELTVRFGHNIPSLTLEQSIGLFVHGTNIINIDSGNIILVYSRWMGSWKYLSTYTLYRKKWLEIAHAKMFGEDDQDYENRTTKLKDEHYLLGDRWDDTIGVMKRADTVNIMILSR